MKFTSSDRFSVQSLYAMINDSGVRQVYTPLVWKLTVFPRLHIFLWLLANNKTLTRDNWAKRRTVEDDSCLFCADKESIQHLFFNCCVAKCMRQVCSDISRRQLGSDFESVLHNKNLKCLNVLTTTVLWTIWKFGNEVCFQWRQWTGMKVLLIRALCKDVEGLDATSKTRGCAGSRSLGGKAGSRSSYPHHHSINICHIIIQTYFLHIIYHIILCTTQTLK
jgi:hypothetical protein